MGSNQRFGAECLGRLDPHDRRAVDRIAEHLSHARKRVDDRKHRYGTMIPLKRLDQPVDNFEWYEWPRGIVYQHIFAANGLEACFH